MPDFIEIYDGVVPRDLCGRIIQGFQASHGVQPGRTGGGIDEALKSSLDLCLTGSSDWADVVEQVWRAADTALVAYVRKYPHLVLGGTAAMLRDRRTGQLIRLDEAFVSRLKDSNVATLIYGIYRRGPLNAQCYPRSRGHYSHWHSEVYPADDDCESLHRALS